MIKLLVAKIIKGFQFIAVLAKSSIVDVDSVLNRHPSFPANKKGMQLGTVFQYVIGMAWYTISRLLGNQLALYQVQLTICSLVHAHIDSLSNQMSIPHIFLLICLYDGLYFILGSQLHGWWFLISGEIRQIFLIVPTEKLGLTLKYQILKVV